MGSVNDLKGILYRTRYAYYLIARIFQHGAQVFGNDQLVFYN
jgi:hypothetical protein